MVVNKNTQIILVWPTSGGHSFLISLPGLAGIRYLNHLK